MARRSGEADRESCSEGALEAATYLVEATFHLAEMARRHQLDMLGYLLDMARLEALETVRLHGAPGDERDRRER